MEMREEEDEQEYLEDDPQLETRPEELDTAPIETRGAASEERNVEI